MILKYILTGKSFVQVQRFMILFILRLALHVCCGSITRNFKLISGSTFNMFVCFQLTEYTITIFPKKEN